MKIEVTVYLVIYFSKLNDAEMVVFTNENKPAIFATEEEAVEFQSEMLKRFPDAGYKILSKDITL